MKEIDNLKLYKRCLIIVDMVNGFVNEGVLHDKRIKQVLPNQLKLIKEAKANNDLIIFMYFFLSEIFINSCNLGL